MTVGTAVVVWAAVVVGATVAGATVVARTTVVVDGTVVARAGVVAGAPLVEGTAVVVGPAVSELAPHAEATNRTATTISSRLMVLVCQTLHMRGDRARHEPTSVDTRSRSCLSYSSAGSVAWVSMVARSVGLYLCRPPGRRYAVLYRQVPHGRIPVRQLARAT